MKKIVCLALSLTAFASFAQSKKTVEFTKKISYKIEVPDVTTDDYYESDYGNINYDHYLDKSGKESLLSFYYNDNNNYNYGGNETNYFVTKNYMVPLMVGGISKEVSYTPYSAFKIMSEGSQISKIDRKGSVNGISCQYYAILRDANSLDSFDYCFCIDESNKINNVSSLFPDSKVKGLILAVDYNNESAYRLVYKSVENTTLKLDLDTEKVVADINAYQEEILNSEEAAEAASDVAAAATYSDYSNIYSDPLYTYAYDDDQLTDYNLYNYISPIYSVTTNALYTSKEYGGEGTVNRNQIASFYKKESKSLVKNLKSAKMITADQKKELDKFFKKQNEKIKAFVPNNSLNDDIADAAAAVAYATVDTASSYVEPYDYYIKYQSSYKEEKIDEIVLAYDLDVKDNKKIKEYAPDYCDNLKNKIPNFKNSDLTKHVHNLAGQICDLYLYNNGGNVGYFETINSMRKSLLEIEKLRSGLSQKDQKLLLEFIKNLD